MQKQLDDQHALVQRLMEQQNGHNQQLKVVQQQTPAGGVGGILSVKPVDLPRDGEPPIEPPWRLQGLRDTINLVDNMFRRRTDEQVVNDKPKEDPSTIKVWSIFPACVCSAGLGLSMSAMILIIIPQAIALLHPANAGQDSLIMTAVASGAGGFTVPLGDMADRDRNFLRPILVTNVALMFSLCVYYSILVLHPSGADAGIYSYVAFTINTFVCGWATSGLGNTGAGLAGVYGMASPRKRGQFAAISGLATLIASTVIVGMLASFPLIDGQYGVIVYSAGISFSCLVLVLLCLNRKVFRPYDYLVRRVDEHANSNSVVSVVWDTIRDFSTEAYRPMALLMVGMTSMFFVMTAESPVAVYILEDLTSLGESPGAAAEYNATVMALGTLVAAFIIVPLGKFVDAKGKPLQAFAWLFIPTMISFFSLILASKGTSWATPALLAMVLIPAVNMLFSVPALISCVVKTDNFARDLNFVFGVSALGPVPFMFLISPTLRFFGETEFEGRDRPRYTYLGYLVIISACAFANFLGLVAACAATSMVDRRNQKARERDLFYG